MSSVVAGSSAGKPPGRPAAVPPCRSPHRGRWRQAWSPPLATRNRPVSQRRLKLLRHNGHRVVVCSTRGPANNFRLASASCLLAWLPTAEAQHMVRSFHGAGHRGEERAGIRGRCGNREPAIASGVATVTTCPVHFHETPIPATAKPPRFARQTLCRRIRTAGLMSVRTQQVLPAEACWKQIERSALLLLIHDQISRSCATREPPCRAQAQQRRRTAGIKMRLSGDELFGRRSVAPQFFRRRHQAAQVIDPSGGSGIPAAKWKVARRGSPCRFVCLSRPSTLLVLLGAPCCWR